MKTILKTAVAAAVFALSGAIAAKAEEIKVSVEPQRLVISGKAETAKEEKTEQTLYNERRTNQFCRTLNLTVAVDPAQATATLKDGMLELVLPKAAIKEAAQVAVKAA